MIQLKTSGDDAPKKKIVVTFYKTEAGHEPVREWLKDLPDEECDTIGGDIQAVEFGWPLGLPLCEKIRDSIWEVRTRLPNTIARVLFVIEGNEMVLLEGFKKKTQKCPNDKIKLALKRLKDWRSHYVDEKKKPKTGK